MSDQTARPRWAIAAGLFVGLFGALSIKSAGEVLFVDGAGRAAAGDYAPFVVWFNFIAGFAYIGGAAGLVLWRPWARPLAIAIAAATIAVFIVFGLFILSGGAFEFRTVGAMTVRSLVWLGVAFALWGHFSAAR